MSTTDSGFLKQWTEVHADIGVGATFRRIQLLFQMEPDNIEQYKTINTVLLQKYIADWNRVTPGQFQGLIQTSCWSNTAPFWSICVVVAIKWSSSFSFPTLHCTYSLHSWWWTLFPVFLRLCDLLVFFLCLLNMALRLLSVGWPCPLRLSCFPFLFRLVV